MRTMFKPGQLVQSIKYGDHYVVISAGPERAQAIPLTPKRWFTGIMFVEYERFRLVCNNYRPKHAHRKKLLALGFKEWTV